MNPNDYQFQAHLTAIYPAERDLEYLALGLASEAGEVAGKVKKWIRDGNLPVEELHKETGDVLWYLVELLTVTGGSLEQIMIDNIKKLNDRKERGVLQGNGDNR